MSITGLADNNAKQTMLTFRKLGLPSERSDVSEAFKRHSTVSADRLQTAHRQRPLVTTVGRTLWTATPASAAVLGCRSDSSTPHCVHCEPSSRSQSWVELAQPSGSHLADWRPLTAPPSWRRQQPMYRWSHRGSFRQWLTVKFRSARERCSRWRPLGHPRLWSHGTVKGWRSVVRGVVPPPVVRTACTLWRSAGVVRRTTHATSAPQRTPPARSHALVTCLCCPLLTVKWHNFWRSSFHFLTATCLLFWIYDQHLLLYAMSSRHH